MYSPVTFGRTYVVVDTKFVSVIVSLDSEEYELENESDSRLQEYASRFPSKVYVLDHVVPEVDQVTMKPFDRVETC